MTVDVSLVVTDRAVVGWQTLASLEIVDLLSEATGTWVMMLDDNRSLSRHAVKNLLLAAEAHHATVAIGGAGSTTALLSGEELCLRHTHLDFNGLLLNRAWLQAQDGLIDELAGGSRLLPTDALGEIEGAVLIPQRTFDQPIPDVVDGSQATIQAAPVGRAAALAFSIARLLPMSTTVLFDVLGDRPVDASLRYLASQWQIQHPDIRQINVTKATRNSWRHAWQLGRARWVITNEQFMSRLPKRAGQTLVVAASELPLQRSGRDNPDWVLQPTSQRRPSWSQMQRWDLVVTSSAFATQVLRSSSGYLGAVVEGESLLADQVAAELGSASLRERLGVKSDLPVVLCAMESPTAAAEVSALAARFEGRLHLRLGEHDWALWCAVADLMITDWSSAAMEFAGLQRPIVALQADHRDVVRRRGTYVDLPQLLPGPVVSSTHELAQKLEDWLARGAQAFPECEERSAAFAQLGSSATGHAASRIWQAMVTAR
ncbi:MAG: CDP-glycerol glycerophosphotransferase family protein [Actinomycetota bacterium]|nr:CDP-glycerol glycerophosphotransferase family protein [Actinomycetota bacterium]